MPLVLPGSSLAQMATDEEIVSGLETLLRQQQVDPSLLNSTSIREQLEAKLGYDLTHKKAFIHSQIDLLVHSNQAHHHHHQQQRAQARPPPAHIGHGHGHGELGGFSAAPPFGEAHMAAFDCVSPVPQQQAPVVQQEAPRESTPATTGKRRGGPGGLTKMCGVSPELQVIVGEPTMPRTQIVKQLWAYIRKNNLQDPSNKRKIICNDALRLVFDTDCTDMFKMNKLLSRHILPLEPSKDSRPDAKRLKAEPQSSTKFTEAGPPPGTISGALAKFFGTGETEMSLSEAVTHVWEYIKANHLEDPVNPTSIICDAKLQELFGCENFSRLRLQDMLDRHIFKR
ncbi:uncharacterized protein LOC18446666 [Amborella trichopoda]|uniref:uncharacterized protein LOC18446666 n=1 Tax=Amborella trichopoda TaxID=13333 RepID=UPI0005D387BD|nr:uncharacterized protein LOC18446666 [Amborella trichopoda]|eukprot:XP_011627948.1 uncharacterized protein LOC18446666 [Amborella trichopoda]